MYSVDMAAERDPTYNDGYEDNVPLGSFLSRPVDIFSQTWTAGDDHNQAFDPWVLWQSDARVKAKLENFAYMSMDLKLRFMLNGSPFQYGRLMIVYIPYGSLDATATADVRNYANQTAQAAQQWYKTTATGRLEATFQHFSTYPHAFLNPSSNDVVEMTLPFVWHNNFLSINGTTSQAKESLGVIRIYALNQLRTANTNAPTECVYQVFCWAENVKVHTPTDFVPTSGRGGIKADEYPDGPVSGTATAVASAAGHLSKVPVIGPFARATQIGAGAISDVARIFGFSAPNRPLEPEGVTLRPHGRLANISGVDSSISLALDPKQEITVDPRTVGVRPNDEMTIKSIVTREQWIARPEWSYDHGQFSGDASKLLFASLVSPNQVHRTGTGTGHGSQTWQAVQDTPGGMIANLFDHWRGSVTYRVECVCTKMHSGRLKLQFDPFVKNGSYAVADVNTTDINTRHTLILDLSEQTEVEFTIPYVNRRAWMQTLNDDTYSMFQPYRHDLNSFDLQTHFNPEVHTGIFTVSVVNALVAPIGTDGTQPTHAPIQVNIYFKCGEDMQFAMPSENNVRWAEMNYVPVSAVGAVQPDEDVTVTQLELFGVHDNPHGPEVFFGERIVSIRSLIKRYGIVFTGKENSGENLNRVLVAHRNLPHTNATVMRDKARRHSYLSYLMPAFVVARGSTRYKITYLQCQNSNVTMSTQWIGVERFATRSQTLQTINFPRLNLQDGTSANLDAFFFRGYNGAAYTHVQNNGTLEFQLPFYSNTRYMLGSEIVNVNNDSDETMVKNVAMTQTLYAKLLYSGYNATANLAQQWFAAGDDFSLHFFLGVPMVWYHQGSST